MIVLSAISEQRCSARLDSPDALLSIRQLLNSRRYHGRCERGVIKLH